MSSLAFGSFSETGDAIIHLWSHLSKYHFRQHFQRLKLEFDEFF